MQFVFYESQILFLELKGTAGRWGWDSRILFRHIVKLNWFVRVRKWHIRKLDWLRAMWQITIPTITDRATTARHRSWVETSLDTHFSLTPFLPINTVTGDTIPLFPRFIVLEDISNTRSTTYNSKKPTCFYTIKL